MAHYLDPKFKPQNRAEKKLQDLWLRFLTEINEKTTEVSQDMLENELIREAVGYMERAGYTKEQLDAYYQWKIDSMTARGMLEEAEIRGMEKGEAIGIEKGEAIGMEKGEVKKALIIAKKLLNKGMSIEDVCDTTGLAKQQIEEVIGT